MKLKKMKLRNDASILTQSELKLIRGGETFYYCRSLLSNKSWLIGL